MLRTAVKQQLRRARESAHRRLYQQLWNCAAINQPIEVVAGLCGAGAQRDALDAAVWMDEVRGGYHADPFGYRTRDGDYHVLVEHYDWSREKGTIRHCRFDGAGFTPPEPLLELPGHLSYPYIVHDAAGLMCLPEASSSKVAALYAVDRDGGARLHRQLFDDRALVDSTIVSWNGHYWLFAVQNRAAWNAELVIYFADALSGPWQPHAANPVKIDAASARPAGTPFVYQGHLYRPAQDCSISYGASIVINRIELLTPTAFAESPVSVLSPHGLARYPTGLHTLSAAGDITLIDAARRTLRPAWPG